MKKTDKKILETGLGKGCRKAYLEDNPHGFRRVLKVHRNKKKYSRKQKYSR